ncbi:hypothetical protein Y032_0243g3506 [Ancylostoma ceylanicum]|uniref:Uncharacterized protein n=1 Tax=Ancylostoma ceylanicum TaxID=53326 RepID=A0A016SEA5_9BILA|nr:hypothetical protein Y032_0243g3506 [Ancylostoma ceylanicum]
MVQHLHDLCIYSSQPCGDFVHLYPSGKSVQLSKHFSPKLLLICCDDCRIICRIVVLSVSNATIVEYPCGQPAFLSFLYNYYLIILLAFSWCLLCLVHRIGVRIDK